MYKLKCDVSMYLTYCDLQPTIWTLSDDRCQRCKRYAVSIAMMWQSAARSWCDGCRGFPIIHAAQHSAWSVKRMHTLDIFGLWDIARCKIFGRELVQYHVEDDLNPTVYWTGPVTFHSFLSSRIRKRISELSLQKKHMPICVNPDGYASPFHPFPFESKSRLKICCHPGDSQEFYARCYFAL